MNIDMEPAPTETGKSPQRSGRKRLSKAPAEADVPRAEPRGARRRLSDETMQAGPPEEGTQPSPTPKAHRARLGSAEAPVAVLEPQEALPGAASDNAPTYAEPEPAAQSRHGATLPGFDRVVNELRSRQSLPMAALGGLLAAVISAMIWAAITVMTRFQIGWMAVGVGVFVGGAVRTLGHGLDKPYGYLGAALSLFGCLLGNFLSACTIIARLEGLSPGVVLTQIDPAAIPALMIATSQPIDTLFYVIAVVMGYHFSFRRITQTHVSRVLQASER